MSIHKNTFPILEYDDEKVVRIFHNNDVYSIAYAKNKLLGKIGDSND